MVVTWNYFILFSNGGIEDNTEPAVKLKAEGGTSRRAQSINRNKWLREKHNIDDIHGSTESLDTAKSKQNKNKKHSEVLKRSYSLGSRKNKNKDKSAFDEAAERRNSKRLRNTIRQKYNLPVRE